MDDCVPVPFGGRIYWLVFAAIFFSRGMDFLSTWVATPNLVLEGNPLAKKLGWKIGSIVNVALCIALSLWPLPAIVISVTSLLVAARNFQHAWLMPSMGEEPYRHWHVLRIRETSFAWYLFCLLAQALLTACVGAALFYFDGDRFFPVAIGLGICGYALAVTFYTLLSVWRIRRVSV